MKARKLKSGVSYKKVCDLLATTHEFSMLKHRVLERICTSKFDGWRMDMDYWGSPVAFATCKLGEGENEMTFSVAPDGGANSRTYTFFLGRDKFVSKSEVEEVVKANFGIAKPGQRKPAVPTYFCSAERVLDMFYDDIDEYLNVRAETDEAKVRIAQQIRDAVQSEDYDKALRTRRAEFIVEDIKKCLMKHKDLTPEIIRTALDMYLIHEVMDN